MKPPTQKEELEHVAHRFRWARLTLNLRVIEVADEAGYTDIDEGCRTLRAIEDGAPQPLIGVYERFAHVLDIDLDDLEAELETLREKRRQKIRQDVPRRILGSLIETSRRRLDLTEEEVIALTQLVPADHYKRRLRRLEAGKARFPTDIETEQFARALRIPPQAIRRAFGKERRIYDRRDDTPELIMHAMPTVGASVPLPDSRSTKWYLDYAEEYARDNEAKVCLVFGDGRSVYIDPDGTRAESYKPPRTALRYVL